ncbi:MAG TPA: hypothetical protein VD865_00830 [Stenotrophomonas sp.]|nr:hypothetical protein [Stenotrophomonas sp.]
MLILRMDEATLCDDGLLEPGLWHGVQALEQAWQLLEQQRVLDAQRARAQARESRARALRRGHRAGMALAARRHVALAAALARAAAALRAELTALLDQRYAGLLAASSSQLLLPELQRCLAAAAPQPVIAVRVAECNFDAVCRWMSETPFPHASACPIAVLADATLEPSCCVVETHSGIVRGGVTAQLHALRQGLHDAARQRLDQLFATWPQGA